MNTISQRCPKCGTYVQMESHTAIGDDTKSLLRGAVKVGTSVATNFAEVGGTYGRIIGGLTNMIIGECIDSIPENYYKYHCPKCGYTWRNLSQNASENTGFVSLKDVPYIENNLSQRASENTGFVSLKDVPCIENNPFRTASVGSYNYPSKNPSKNVSSDIEDKYNEQLVTLQEEVVDIATNKSKALEYISGKQ